MQVLDPTPERPAEAALRSRHDSGDVGVGRRFPDRVQVRLNRLSVREADADGEVCLQKPGAGESTRLDCASGVGAATFVTGGFGFVAASRVLARLAKRAVESGDR